MLVITRGYNKNVPSISLKTHLKQFWEVPALGIPGRSRSAERWKTGGDWCRSHWSQGGFRTGPLRSRGAGGKGGGVGGPTVKWSLSCEVLKKDLVSDVLNMLFFSDTSLEPPLSSESSDIPPKINSSSNVSWFGCVWPTAGCILVMDVNEGRTKA